MIDTQCVVCGNNKKTKVLYKSTFNNRKFNSNIFSARRTPDKLHYRLLKCSKCGLIFSNPIFSKKKIDDLYLKSEFNYAPESKYLKKTYFYYFKKKLLKDNKNLNLKILEIGCGNGFFLEELRDNGYKNVYGIEPGKSSVDKSRKDIKKKIRISVFKENIFPKNYFDIICCFHTLDHIVNPNVFLKGVYALLKNEGKVFFIVHDTGSLSVKIFGEKSPIFDIEHTFLFNKSNLKELFIKNSFIKTKAINIHNTFPLQYWLKLLPLSNNLKNTLLNLTYILRVSNIPIKISAGNVGFIASKLKLSKTYINLEKCNFCGEKRRTTLHELEIQNMVICKKCHLIYLDRQRIDVENLYSKNYFKADEKNDIAKYDNYKNQELITKKKFSFAYKYIGKNNLYTSRLLEVGSGYGYFLKFLPRNIKKYVVEVSKIAAKETKRNNNDAKIYDKDFRYVPLIKKFDYIVSFDVIEHQIDLRWYLEKVYSLLKKNGIFIFTTPDYGTRLNLLFGKNAPVIQPFYHNFYFNQEWLKKNLRKLGFKVIFIKTTHFEPMTLGYLLLYISFAFPFLKNISLVKIAKVVKLDNYVIPFFRIGGIEVIVKKI